ncbi:MAG: long-chain fatty acid--CoA ligase [Shewanella fodinae]|nr:long-chain fatty acid--CoA ligase [Shewanella fodinae]
MASNTSIYQQLAQRVEALGNWLQQQQVACVALHGGNSIDWVIVDLACHAANIVCLPLPLFFTPQQIRSCLEQAGAELLLSEELLLPGQCKLDLDEALPGVVAWPLPERFHCWELPFNSTEQLPEGTKKNYLHLRFNRKSQRCLPQPRSSMASSTVVS